MLKSKVEKLVGQKVTVKIFDNASYTGYLQKTGTVKWKDNPTLFLTQNRYFITETEDSHMCTSCLFRSSHITSIESCSEPATEASTSAPARPTTDNHLFSNYPAFKDNFEPIIIKKVGVDLFIAYREQDGEENYMQQGSREYMNGWLYGAVQAVHGRFKRRA